MGGEIQPIHAGGISLYGFRHRTDGFSPHAYRACRLPLWTNGYYAWSLALNLTSAVQCPEGHRIVPPSAYVELRALAIAEQALESFHSPDVGIERTWLRRLWPFRWPAEAPGDLIPQPQPDPHEPQSGDYIDIVV